MFSVLVLAVLLFSEAQGGLSIDLRSLGNAQKLPLNNRIIGGEETTINNVPYIIALLFDGKQACGGSIIAVNRILTAAHCVYGQLPSHLSIRAGSTYKSSGGQVIQVERFLYHENYVAEDVVNDVAILYLSASITLSNSSKIIPMMSHGQNITDGAMGRTSGWGTMMFEEDQYPEALRTVFLPIVNQEICYEAYYGRITNGMICAGFIGVGGKDACQLDSGGPLEVDGVLVGVVSWGEDCGDPDYPGVYSKVSYFRNWIDEKIQLG